MSKRPYFDKSITDLESVYLSNSHDRRVLMDLSKELAHRSTPKAKALRGKVEKSLAGELVSPGGTPPPPSPGMRNVEHPAIAPANGEAQPPARVAIECGNCGESNFVSMLPDIVQHLSCPHCKTSYEAIYKHGVMRSKFAEKPINSNSGTPPWVWVLLAAAVMAAIYVFK